MGSGLHRTDGRMDRVLPPSTPWVVVAVTRFVLFLSLLFLLFLIFFLIPLSFTLSFSFG